MGSGSLRTSRILEPEHVVGTAKAGILALDWRQSGNQRKNVTQSESIFRRHWLGSRMTLLVRRSRITCDTSEVKVVWNTRLDEESAKLCYLDTVALSP